MSNASAHTRTVAEMVTTNFNRARIFERFGIDYCCGGKVSLPEACSKAGANLDTVEAALSMADREAPETTSPDYYSWGTVHLAKHIVEVHHAYVRTEVPRIMDLFDHVVKKHGEQNPELKAAQDVFVVMAAELLNHMQHEERVLFPLCDKTQQAEMQGGMWWLLDALEHDHSGTGANLAQLRRLLYNYEPTPDMCRKRVALLHALSQFEQDMHLHIHKENNVLFPQLRSRVEQAS